MSNDLSASSAPEGDMRVRHQRARIEQRHLQFGRHCGLDIECLVSTVNRVRVAPRAQVVMAVENAAPALMEHSMRGIINDRPSHSVDAVHVAVQAPARTAMRDSPRPERRHAAGPATLGDFVASSRADAFAHREWVATLADLTTVVVNDRCGAPSQVGIEKAVSIVQSRGYLEQRARLLLLRLTREAESWRLLRIDFATAARRHGYEFLMCFTAQGTSGVLSSASPSVEIGFALPMPTAVDPVFVLTVVNAGAVAATAHA